MFKLAIGAQDHPSLHQAKKNETQQKESTKASPLNTEDTMSIMETKQNRSEHVNDIEVP